jgi:hypothetical protein
MTSSRGESISRSGLFRQGILISQPTQPLPAAVLVLATLSGTSPEREQYGHIIYVISGLASVVL